jgi:NADH-quinone oxidoreductase subunit J
VGATVTTGAGASAISNEGFSTRALSLALFQQYLFPFEATSILILIALLGALILARKDE